MPSLNIPLIPDDDEITAFPAVEMALEEPNGLLMAGGALTPLRLLDAYRLGIFPWYSEDEPVLWWSPDPRCVLWPDKLKISRSLRKTIKGQRFHVTENQVYGDVMRQCAAPREGSDGTWITEDIIAAYSSLNHFGLTQSIEVWHNDELVGGLYGVCVGHIFVGESMFSRMSDASKVALAYLAQLPRYKLIDCQLPTNHLMSLGAELISRKQYQHYLAQYSTPEDLTINPNGLSEAGQPNLNS